MTVAICELDLSKEIEPIQLDPSTGELRILVRFDGCPVGWVRLTDLGRASLTPSGIRQVIARQIGPLLASFGLAPRLAARPAEAEPLEPISVIVCTRGLTNNLQRCLQALGELDYPNYEIIVVRYGPRHQDSLAGPGRAPVRIVHETQPGLPQARNRGVVEAGHNIVAFAGEDTCPDRGWLRAIAQAFSGPQVKAVTGPILPAELDTPAQMQFDALQLEMGRGLLRRRIIRRGALPGLEWSRLIKPKAALKQGYGHIKWVWRAELTRWDLIWEGALSTGRNMAFRRDIFTTVGFFDPGPGGDILAGEGGAGALFLRLLVQGYALVYEPSALVWQTYPRQITSVRRFAYERGRAMGAYLLTCAHDRTLNRGTILSFASREWLMRWLLRRLFRPGTVPRRLVALELMGAILSPLTYRAASKRAWQADMASRANPVVDATDRPVLDRMQS
jgi:cellulose synthase/poly-beta-1,6-N-acetylglucosamine synthase-like glycosyltransferase